MKSEGFNTEPTAKPEEAEPPMVVGAKKNPDGTMDYSRAMTIINSEEIVKENSPGLSAEEQRERIIEGKIKAQREANPNTIIDVEQARKYWRELYDTASPGMRMDSQVEESYASRYEEGLISMRKEMLSLEAQLNTARTEKEKQASLEQIASLRNSMRDLEKEISERRARTNI